MVSAQGVHRAVQHAPWTLSAVCCFGRSPQAHFQTVAGPMMFVPATKQHILEALGSKRINTAQLCLFSFVVLFDLLLTMMMIVTTNIVLIPLLSPHSVSSPSECVQISMQILLLNSLIGVVYLWERGYDIEKQIFYWKINWRP